MAHHSQKRPPTLNDVVERRPDGTVRWPVARGRYIRVDESEHFRDRDLNMLVVDTLLAPDTPPGGPSLRLGTIDISFVAHIRRDEFPTDVRMRLSEYTRRPEGAGNRTFPDFVTNFSVHRHGSGFAGDMFLDVGLSTLEQPVSPVHFVRALAALAPEQDFVAEGLTVENDGVYLSLLFEQDGETLGDCFAALNDRLWELIPDALARATQQSPVTFTFDLPEEYGPACAQYLQGLDPFLGDLGIDATVAVRRSGRSLALDLTPVKQDEDGLEELKTAVALYVSLPLLTESDELSGADPRLARLALQVDHLRKQLSYQRQLNTQVHALPHGDGRADGTLLLSGLEEVRFGNEVSRPIELFNGVVKITAYDDNSLSIDTPRILRGLMSKARRLVSSRGSTSPMPRLPE